MLVKTLEPLHLTINRLRSLNVKLMTAVFVPIIQEVRPLTRHHLTIPAAAAAVDIHRQAAVVAEVVEAVAVEAVEVVPAVAVPAVQEVAVHDVNIFFTQM
jgi:hypothetical protein